MSADMISSLEAVILRPCTGVRLIRFFSPFFALSVVIFSKIAPISIINATSPAANKSPMAIAAAIAVLINRAEDILLIPLLWMILCNARYNSGSPQIITVPHAGSAGNMKPIRGKKKLKARRMPPRIVIGSPVRK